MSESKWSRTAGELAEYFGRLDPAMPVVAVEHDDFNDYWITNLRTTEHEGTLYLLTDDWKAGMLIELPNANDQDRETI